MRRIPVTLVVALLALCLTATAVFAAKTPGMLTAPKTGPALTLAPDKPPEASSRETEATEPSESEEADAREVDEAAAPHPNNHGGVVSAAAQGDTPDGCRNHGQWVSTIARWDGQGEMPTTCATQTDTSGAPAVDTTAAPKHHGHGKK